jgi:hypothetical protein
MASVRAVCATVLKAADLERPVSRSRTSPANPERSSWARHHVAFSGIPTRDREDEAGQRSCQGCGLNRGSHGAA